MDIAERTRIRESHIICGRKKEGEFIPYSEDESRVVNYLDGLVGIGGGADPIGFLIASHNMLVMQRNN